MSAEREGHAARIVRQGTQPHNRRPHAIAAGLFKSIFRLGDGSYTFLAAHACEGQDICIFDGSSTFHAF